MAEHPAVNRVVVGSRPTSSATGGKHPSFVAAPQGCAREALTADTHGPQTVFAVLATDKDPAVSAAGRLSSDGRAHPRHG